MLHRRWFPDQIDGTTVVLKRHTRDNLPDFLRWYQDPEVARLTRYQDGPMRPDEIERFFMMRALGPDTLAMGIHVRDTGRLIGSCAFSQLDADNGSVLFHITIGEHDAWGHGYGGEATTLMVDHAFTSLGLHRVSLSVFAFNERAIRSYARVGFVSEGRAREAIWRDGRWWDEIHMSVLEPEWRAARWQARAIADGRAPAPVPAVRRQRQTAAAVPVAPAASPRRVGIGDGEHGPGGRRGARGVPGAVGGEGPRRGERPQAVAGLDAAFASGALRRTPALAAMLADLAVALDQDEGQRLGGKSAEAARFILRAISRELDNA